MTKPAFTNPTVDEWFTELEAVITHEMLKLLVDRNALAEGKWIWGNTLEEAKIAIPNCYQEYIDKLIDVQTLEDIRKLEGSVGSFSSVSQAERFLLEKDYLLQFIDNNSISDLSIEAQNRLAKVYPLAEETIEYCMKEISDNDIPKCLRSLSLNQDVNISELWDDNDLIEICEYHIHLLARTKSYRQSKLDKPKLVTSFKRNKYIDIYVEEIDSEDSNTPCFELVSRLKIDEISDLSSNYKSRVLSYCHKLIEAYTQHLTAFKSSENPKPKPTPEYLPSPPTEFPMVKRYDGYMSLLIGLYCLKSDDLCFSISDSEIKNENKFFFSKYSSFQDFLRKDLFPKFSFHYENRYQKWALKNGKDQEVTKELYINTVMSRSVKENIKSVRNKMLDLEGKYFTDHT